jgi:hypothetical protein
VAEDRNIIAARSSSVGHTWRSPPGVAEDRNHHCDGVEYLSPEAAVAFRGGRGSQPVLLLGLEVVLELWWSSLGAAEDRSG